LENGYLLFLRGRKWRMVVRARRRPGAVGVVVVMAVMGGQLRAGQGVRLWDVMKMKQEARDAAQECQDIF
jgi:hypothetical protein